MGLAKGHGKGHGNKHESGDEGDGGGDGEGGEPTAISTSSTLAFALSPPVLTVSGNTCTVSGLETGRDMDASSEFVPDDGSSGFINGIDANESPDTPGEYSWLFDLADQASAGQCNTWLREKGSPLYPVTPLSGPDGEPLKWSFHFDG